MKKSKYPKYVKFTHPKGYSVTLKFFWAGTEPRYWRLAGAWNIGCEFKGKKLVMKATKAPNGIEQEGYALLRKLDGLELVPCTRKEFLADNESAFNYRFYGESDVRKIG